MRQSFTNRTLTGILVTGFILSSIFSSPFTGLLVNSFVNAGLNSWPKQDMSLFDEEGQSEERAEWGSDDDHLGKSPVELTAIRLYTFGSVHTCQSAIHHFGDMPSQGVPRFLAFHSLLL